MDQSASPQRLTARILSATRAGHDKTDRLAQLRSVTALRDARLYRQLLRDFWVVYRSFERGWQQVMRQIDMDPRHSRASELLRAVWMPELARAAAFEADLEFYYAEDARQQPEAAEDEASVAHRAIQLAENSLSDAARNYEEHIHAMVQQDPIRLLAYIYTMYSAITAGGQILRSRLVKHLLFFKVSNDDDSLPRSALHPQLVLSGQQLFDYHPVVRDGQGEEAIDNDDEVVEEWRLEQPISRAKLRVELKRRLDALPLTETEVAAVIDEAHGIFARNALVMGDATQGAGWHLLRWALGWGAVAATMTGVSIWLFSQLRR